MKSRQRRSEALSTTTAAKDEYIARGLMSARSVRDLTGLSKAEVYKCVQRGTFVSMRIGEGRGIRIYRASVEQWLMNVAHAESAFRFLSPGSRFAIEHVICKPVGYSITRPAVTVLKTASESARMIEFPAPSAVVSDAENGPT